MNKESCLICSAFSRRMVDISNTHLKEIYEKLTDLKVHQESHYLCFVCHRRLQQCYQLQQMAIKPKHESLSKTPNSDEPHNSIITLSFSKLLIVTIPCYSNHLAERKTINLKQEVDEEVTCVLELESEQERLEYVEKQEIKIENVFSECLSLEPINANHSEIEKDTQLLQNYDYVDIKLEKIYTENDLDDNKSMENETKYSCNICPYKTNSESNLNKHLLFHTTSLKNQIYEKTIPRRIKKKQSFICDICKKTFTAKFSLMIHIRTHTGYKPYECNECDKSYCQKSHLVVHKRKKHTGIKIYHCTPCKLSFSVKSDYITHYNTHAAKKPYKCDICYKRFAQKFGLKAHHLFHTNEKPHSCDVCNKAFRLNSTLITHKRTHTGEKPYICHQCYRSFTTSSSLARHKRLIKCPQT